VVFVGWNGGISCRLLPARRVQRFAFKASAEATRGCTGFARSVNRIKKGSATIILPPENFNIHERIALSFNRTRMSAFQGYL
jgi:hypothetical protein